MTMIVAVAVDSVRCDEVCEASGPAIETLAEDERNHLFAGVMAAVVVDVMRVIADTLN
jgi:hypothetical protein